MTTLYYRTVLSPSTLCFSPLTGGTSATIGAAEFVQTEVQDPVLQIKHDAYYITSAGEQVMGTNVGVCTISLPSAGITSATWSGRSSVTNISDGVYIKVVENCWDNGSLSDSTSTWSGPGNATAITSANWLFSHLVAGSVEDLGEGVYSYTLSSYYNHNNAFVSGVTLSGSITNIKLYASNNSMLTQTSVPASGTWTTSGATVSQTALTSKLSTASGSQAVSLTPSSGSTYLLAKLVSLPLINDFSFNNVQGVLGYTYSNSNDSRMRIITSIRENTLARRGSDLLTYEHGTQATTAVASAGTSFSSGITSTTAYAGDFVLVEMGMKYLGSSTAGTGTYYFGASGGTDLASGGNAASSQGWITLGSSSPPTVTAQPTTTGVFHGTSASFTAGASDATGQHWERSTDGGTNWSDISGETSTTLTLTGYASGHNYQYHCVFSNAGGSTSSNAATLYVADEGGILVDSGFEGYADGTAPNSGVWTATTGTSAPLSGKYDTAIYKAGSGSFYIQGASGANYGGYYEKLSTGMAADGAEYRWWSYCNTTNEYRSLVDFTSSNADRTVSFRYRTDGKMDQYTQVTGVGYSTGYNVLDYSYSTGWTQYKVVLNFTNKNFKFYYRTTPGASWTGIKTTGAADYNIPFTGSGTVSATSGLMIRPYSGAAIRLDDIRFSTMNIPERISSTTGQIDGRITNRYSATGSIDASITGEAGAETYTSSGVVDAIVRKTDNKTAIIHAVTRQTSSSTGTVDSIIRASSSTASSADAIIRTTSSKETSLEATVLSTSAAIAPIHSIVRVTSAVGNLVDSLINVTGSVSRPLGAIVRQTSGTSFVLDALVLLRTSKETAIDSIVFATQSTTATVNGFIWTEGLAVTSIHGSVLATQSKTANLDAIITARETEFTSLMGILAQYDRYFTYDYSSKVYGGDHSAVQVPELSSPFESADYTAVLATGGAAQDSSGAGAYIYVRFEQAVPSAATSHQVYWSGESSIATSANPLYLYAYDHTNSEWREITSNSDKGENEAISLSGQLSNDYVNDDYRILILLKQEGVR